MKKNVIKQIHRKYKGNKLKKLDKPFVDMVKGWTKNPDPTI